MRERARARVDGRLPPRVTRLSALSLRLIVGRPPPLFTRKIDYDLSPILVAYSVNTDDSLDSRAIGGMLSPGWGGGAHATRGEG